jgi:hypothetical protein
MPIPELLSDATVQFLIRFAPFSRMATARGLSTVGDLVDIEKSRHWRGRIR